MTEASLFSSIAIVSRSATRRLLVDILVMFDLSSSVGHELNLKSSSYISMCKLQFSLGILCKILITLLLTDQL